MTHEINIGLFLYYLITSMRVFYLINNKVYKYYIFQQFSHNHNKEELLILRYSTNKKKNNRKI